MPDKNTKDLSYFVKALQQRQAIDDVNSKLLRLPEDKMNLEFSVSLTKFLITMVLFSLEKFESFLKVGNPSHRPLSSHQMNWSWSFSDS